MAGSTIIKGHARQALVRNTALSMTGSAGSSFGVFDAGKFSRLAGVLSIVGSATFRYQMGADSSAFQVSSTFVVNSGGSIFDVLNYGNHVNLSLSAAASQTGAVVLIYGEPIR